MGVPRYRATLSKFCQQGFYAINKGDSIQDCDNLYIDFNPVIHLIAGNVFGYSKTDESIAVENPTVEIVYQKCWEYLIMLIEHFSPSEKVYIAIDGVAPVAKQNQQRQRRFMSAKHSSGDTFNSSWISVGTLFMNNLYNFLRVKLTEWLDTWASEITYDVILSSDKVPGEGEHKIIQDIRNSDQKGTSYIYGPDGDLLFLTLLLKEKIYIVTDSLSTYQCCDIQKIKDYIGKLLSPKWGKNEDYDQRVIRDYVMLCSIFGNDFLPKLKMVYSLEKAWELITDIYQKNYGFSGEITLVDEDGTPILDHLKDFFKLLAENEIAMIESQNSVEIADERFRDSLLQSCMIQLNGIPQLYFEGYRDAYYEREGDPVKMCKNYWDTFIWSYQYYLTGKVNWTQSYNFYEAPFLVDLLKNWTVETSSPIELLPESFTPFIQLACIMPPSMKKHLPKEYQVFFDPKCSQYLGEEFFPVDFEYDLSGKFSEHQGVARLPFCDRKKLVEILSKVEIGDYNRNTRTTEDTWNTMVKESKTFLNGKIKFSTKNIRYNPARKN